MEKQLMNYLHISEKFYSIQGEGRTMGVPAIFIRLGGCNLLCKSATWICDTIDVWRESNKVEYKDVFSDDDINKLNTKRVHLIITGGEPMLHQSNIISFLLWFEKHYRFLPIVEIETNGTIKPTTKLFGMVAYWNVSPKLSNSGEPKNKRRISKVIRYFSRLGHKKVIFKYVVSKESDVDEIFRDYSATTLRNIYLMPAGASQEELNNTRPIVANLCKTYNFKYSERLHVVIWDKATGV